jgi:hypothetical protein
MNPIDDTGWLRIIRLEYLSIPIQIEDRACAIKGKVKHLEVVRFKIFGMNPVSGMGGAHDDHLCLDLRVKGLFILERIVRIHLSIHP